MSLQIFWELINVGIPIFFATALLECMEHGLEYVVQLLLWIFVVNYCTAEEGEVVHYSLCVPTDRVAQAFVGLVLLLIVVFQVAQTHAPLLGNFLKVNRNCFGVNQAKAT